MSTAAKKASTDDSPPAMSDALRLVAERLIWWQPPSVSLQQPSRLLAQVMVLGNWGDVQAARRAFGEEAFRQVLRAAPPGLFDMRSWTYWHHALNLLPVPPLPQRRLPSHD